jgi:hypothetical protein
MTSYPHKPFSEPPQPNDRKAARQKQLQEVRKRRAIIFKMMQRMSEK